MPPSSAPPRTASSALASEFGVGKFPTFDNGDNVYVDFNGKRSTYSDTGAFGSAPPDPAIAADLAHVVLTLDQMSTEVPVSAPWTAPKAAEWDGQTLAKWVADNSSNSAAFRALIPLATRSIFGAEPRELSLLFTLFYIAASGDAEHPGTFERNFNTRMGAQMWRLHGGTQALAIKVAKALGQRVVLNTPVEGIARLGSSVTVHARDLEVSAQQVIVAIPPTLAGQIHYTPDAAREADPAHQSPAAGKPDQGGGGVRHAVLAR